MYTDRELAVLKSSAPLCRINNEGLPSSSASGCIVDYSGHRILLTVEHATGDFGQWAIQLHFDKSKGTQLYRLGAMNFLAHVSLKTGEEKTIDFAYVEIPKDLEAMRQEITELQEVTKSYPITAFQLDLDEKPSKDDQFAFAGLVKGQLEKHPSVTFFASELKIYDGLKYLRTEGDKYVFELPFNHPGHPEFDGCSGAPILNNGGNPVALLTGGCIKNNEIYGVSLNQYRTPIDILVGNIK